MIPYSPHATFLRRDLRSHAVLVLRDDVATLVDQLKRELSSQPRIVPCVAPAHVYFGIGVDAFDSQREGVESANNLGKAIGGDVSNPVGSCLEAGDNPGEISNLVHPSEVLRHVAGHLSPCATEETNVWMSFRHDGHLVREPVTAGKDDSASLIDEFLD